MIAGLISLEATGVDCCCSRPASLLRTAAEQAAEFTHVDLLLPSTERGVIRRFVDVKLFTDGSGVIEPCFSLSEIFVEFRMQEDKSDLSPLGEPAGAVRRSGFVRVIHVLFGKILTLPYDRSFRPHIARRRPIPHKPHGNQPRTRLKLVLFDAATEHIDSNDFPYSFSVPCFASDNSLTATTNQ